MREEEKEGEREVRRERYGKNESENGCSCLAMIYSPTHKQLSNGLSILKAVVHS